MAPSPTLSETGLAPGCEASRSRACRGEGPLVPMCQWWGLTRGLRVGPPCLSRAGPGVLLFEGGDQNPPLKCGCLPSGARPSSVLMPGASRRRDLGRWAWRRPTPPPVYPGRMPPMRRRWPTQDWVGQRVEVGWSPEGGWVLGLGGWGVVGFLTTYAYGPPFLRNPSAPKNTLFFYLD